MPRQRERHAAGLPACVFQRHDCKRPRTAQTPRRARA